ncbi:hypothetical protein D6D17_08797 [Aureobasidium pullulans]|nr:hypothetical protein D6D17_08797 [Aureobasidium pullulans]
MAYWPNGILSQWHKDRAPSFAPIACEPRVSSNSLPTMTLALLCLLLRSLRAIAQPGVTQKKGAIGGKKMPATTTKNEDGTEKKDSQEEAQTRHYQLPGVQKQTHSDRPIPETAMCIMNDFTKGSSFLAYITTSSRRSGPRSLSLSPPRVHVPLIRKPVSSTLMSRPPHTLRALRTSVLVALPHSRQSSPAHLDDLRHGVE